MYVINDYADQNEYTDTQKEDHIRYIYTQESFWVYKRNVLKIKAGENNPGKLESVWGVDACQRREFLEAE